MNILRTKNLVKRFDQEDVLKGITIAFEQGTVTSIIGPSGSGKSTLLRCLNQLEAVSDGQVFYRDQDLTNRHVNINHIRSRIGMVFQSFNLFDNMSVLRNITIGQELILKRSKEEAKERALHYLEKVGLLAFRDRRVNRLSGGQKQRVAIARTLAMDPEIILFDEPTSSLDPLMVGEVLRVIRDVVREDFTVIVVTHEMEFARDISERVIYMEDGEIVVDDDSTTVFTNPTNPKLQHFLKRVL
ncbi:amino acid ABC transporter ATP-binding protein [Candidatus Xianfuyuplasma coldseepsis]|uniref:amino acid ABC transporter ATP-binding protein n=1 Tax=Candidatus Xianfuyuplasma coldseepsis TaxID=2782163 RepID=UPI002161EBE8|nr:amino acid ABC transporter ATP-binding protein [Xianfuyuplasma coldseepsis]